MPLSLIRRRSSLILSLLVVAIVIAPGALADQPAPVDRPSASACLPAQDARRAEAPSSSRWPATSRTDIVDCFTGVDAAFVLLHLATGQRIELGGERVTTRLAPCSTFKLPHALIGLECGLLAGPNQRFAWDGRARSIKAWERDHSLRSSMAYSVVPIYQGLAAQIGPRRMQAWLDRFAYGNRDISSGQTSFWLGGSLKISATEQVEFLQRMVGRRLPVASQSLAVVDEITRLERFADGEYHGKTGSHWENGRWTLGWWVGWIKRGADRYVFAANIRGQDGCSGIEARKRAERALHRLGILPTTRADRLALEYAKFDQDLSGGGWRALGDGGCHLEAAKLLEDYLAQHTAALQPWQVRILRWHAGQMQAFAGETTAALQHFRQSYDTYDVNKNAPLRWNAYVRGTIAFLQGDAATLKVCRDAMLRGPTDPKWVGPNLAVLERLFAGLGQQSYREAYCGESVAVPRTDGPG